MAAFDENSKLSPARARGPIFVDVSGKRLRRARATGLVALALVSGYVALLVVALLGGPNVAAPYLPQRALLTPQPSQTSSPGSVAASRPEVAPSSAPRTNAPVADYGPGPAAAAPVPNAVPVQPAVAAVPQVPVAAPAPAAPAPVAAPAPAAVPTPAEATAPGKSGSAPGQTSRPTTPSHP